MDVIHALKNFIMRTRPLRLGKIYKLMVISEVGVFFKEHDAPFRFKDRYDVYRHIQENFVKDQAIDFLEFGVYRGDSLNFWTNLNANPASRFFGFDSFEGLPEEWVKVLGSVPKGTFDVDGKIPTINDKRVKLIKGLFQETIGNFLRSYNTNDNIKILHLDADLYTSTLFVLTKFDDFLKKGDIVIFDEFSAGDEYMAFRDYSLSYMREFSIIAVSGPSSQQVALIVDK